jgi:hypothetical protein
MIVAGCSGMMGYVSAGVGAIWGNARYVCMVENDKPRTLMQIVDIVIWYTREEEGGRRMSD